MTTEGRLTLLVLGLFYLLALAGAFVSPSLPDVDPCAGIRLRP